MLKSDAYSFSYFREKDEGCVANNSYVSSIDKAIHGFTNDTIPEAKDVVRIDLVGGFALQKVNDERSYFRTIANMDMKLDFVPPSLINFISRKLAGNGFKLYQKTVASVKKCDKDYRKALRDPLFSLIREALYTGNKSCDVLAVHELESEADILRKENLIGDTHYDTHDIGQEVHHANDQAVKTPLRKEQDTKRKAFGEIEEESEKSTYSEERFNAANKCSTNEFTDANGVNAKRTIPIRPEVEDALRTLEKVISVARQHGFNPRSSSSTLCDEEMVNSEGGVKNSIYAADEDVNLKAVVEDEAHSKEIVLNLETTSEKSRNSSENNCTRHLDSSSLAKEVNHDIVVQGSPRPNVSKPMETNQVALSSYGNGTIKANGFYEHDLNEVKKSSSWRKHRLGCFSLSSGDRCFDPGRRPRWLILDDFKALKDLGILLGGKKKKYENLSVQMGNACAKSDETEEAKTDETKQDGDGNEGETKDQGHGESNVPEESVKKEPPEEMKIVREETGKEQQSKSTETTQRQQSKANEITQRQQSKSHPQRLNSKPSQLSAFNEGKTETRKQKKAHNVKRQSCAGLKVDSVLQTKTGHLKEYYNLGRKLGRGQFGTTFLCIEKGTGKEFACKSIAKRKLMTIGDVDDVKREIQIMHHLSGHPKVISIKGSYEDSMAVHVVMELCAGGELFDRIVKRGHYSERKAAEIARIVVSVIEACHAMGVMHRDLKPENFLFVNQEEDSPLKAIDFGLSIFFKPAPYYVAPEVLRKLYGPEADVWSAGVITYILLSGVPPFWGETEQEIFNEVLNGELDFSTDPWPNISESAKELVRKMLERDTKKRITAHEVLRHPWVQVDGVIAQRLSEEEIAGLKEMFKMIDTDCSGQITYDELKEGLKKFGANLAESEFHALMQAADINNSGTIDYEEFVTATLHLNKIEREDNLLAAFLYFDRDRSGYITPDELQNACQEFGIEDIRLDEIMKEVDADNDGRIDYNEFVAMMLPKVGMKVGLSLREDRRFTVKSAYASTEENRNTEADELWTIIHRYRGLQKIKLFLWLIYCGRVMTNAERMHRHITTDSSCPEFIGMDLRTWLLMNLGDATRFVQQHNWDILFGALTWNIWLHRNYIMFDRITEDNRSALERGKQLMEYTKRAVLLGSTHQSPQLRCGDGRGRWTRPTPGWTKVNTDDAKNRVAGLTSSGGVLRSHEGEWKMEDGICVEYSILAATIVEV
ncbi:Calcium-dependent protein kinase 1 [Hibiscus syriacus]|uniref:non-specific serine/threonine protein kinase n=1 Tax=Hibiscus syriacus TaxID=106335 RepID=A0A6A3CTU4_HIBSY|nr:Calcium-dependent protein kinase 1 [Hibiscus syriacus]